MTIHRHFLIHKPYGYLSQFITNQKGNKHKLLSDLPYDFPENIMAIGRLDLKSEGLLLLTTDGKVSDYITTRGQVEKEYYVQIDGIITPSIINQLQTGVEIGFDGKKYMTKSCKVKAIAPPKFPKRSQKIRDDRHGPTSWISMTLTEGKFRQVRKMTSAVGLPTLRLIRVRVGNFVLTGLDSGAIQEVVSLQ